MSSGRPQEAVIRGLLQEGLTNAAIGRQLGVDTRVVAGIRKDAGLPAAERTAWARAAHPKQAEIQQLLGEGHTDAEIRRRTGADVSTVARMRKAGGYGPARIIRRGTRVHPKDAQIRELIAQGLSNTKVAQETGADRSAVRRIRGEMGVALPPAQPLSLEEMQRLQELHRQLAAGVPLAEIQVTP